MGTERPRHNLGRAAWIGAEAIGVPGQRTFRLLVMGEHNSAQLWLEKEQLQALAEAIARLLLEIRSEEEGSALPGAATQDNPKPTDFPANPDVELYIGTLGLRYDPQRSVVAIEVFDRESEETVTPTLRCVVTTEQLQALQNDSIEVIAAGRPRCPFCGTPLSESGVPHFCPPMNGHQKLTDDE